MVWISLYARSRSSTLGKLSSLCLSLDCLPSLKIHYILLMPSPTPKGLSTSISGKKILAKKSCQHSSFFQNKDEAISTQLATSSVIEMDELNKHETMTTLLSLIHHMRNKQIYKQPTTPTQTPSTSTSSQPTNQVSLPSWMVYLQKKISSRSTHLNIKLFIAKLIINEPKVSSLLETTM